MMYPRLDVGDVASMNSSLALFARGHFLLQARLGAGRACMLERHITLDRAMWGSDQAASVEPQGFARLVRDVRAIELSFGDGQKRVYDSEVPIQKKLRRKG